jgi:glutamate racemase
VFDSGIGGLTVLKEIISELPYEDTIYFGDTARVPYGIRSPETVTRYSFESARFLSAKGIKVLVIACNTVSSVSLGALQKAAAIPVIGVIEPGAKAAVAVTGNKKVGVIGTTATIQSGSYARAIKALDNSVEVTGLACPLFVPLVEEGWTEGKIVEMIAEKYLKEIRDSGIDTLVLGCTHYPLLKGVLSRFLGNNVTLIDSAIETAREIKALIERSSLLKSSSGGVKHEYYVTDSPEKFREVGERFMGRKLHNIQKIELKSEV